MLWACLAVAFAGTCAVRGLPTDRVVLLGWVVFRAATVPQALGFYAGLLGLNGLALAPELAVQITRVSPKLTSTEPSAYLLN